MHTLLLFSGERNIMLFKGNILFIVGAALSLCLSLWGFFFFAAWLDEQTRRLSSFDETYLSELWTRPERSSEREAGWGERQKQIRPVNHDSWLWSAIRTSQIASRCQTFSLALSPLSSVFPPRVLSRLPCLNSDLKISSDSGADYLPLHKGKEVALKYHKSLLRKTLVKK